ncbi:MAG: DUF3299 domain-containing protein [Alphaproteobacteria bacterium]
MLKKVIRPLAAFTAIFLLCGFSKQEISVGQPSAEREAQNALPQSHDNLWAAFIKCKVHLDPKKYTYTIDYTPEVKAMEGKPFTISGFMLPLEAKIKFTHYLLSKRTPTCLFCPPGEPNEIVEVFSKKPVEWDDGIVTITGTMKFINDPETGLFFQMQNAERHQ